MLYSKYTVYMSLLELRIYLDNKLGHLNIKGNFFSLLKKHNLLIYVLLSSLIVRLPNSLLILIIIEIYFAIFLNSIILLIRLLVRL